MISARLIVGFVTGVFVSVLIGWIFGRVDLNNDFFANVAGAAVGGTITVALALSMFARERRAAQNDAKASEAARWKEAVRQELRYIRASHEAADIARNFTYNNAHDHIGALNDTSRRTANRLKDSDLTDVPLRNGMVEAIGVVQSLITELTQLRTDASDALPDKTIHGAVQAIEDRQLELKAIMSRYEALRGLPTVA